MGGGVDFFTQKKEALRQFMDRETYEKFMKYPSQRGITQHPLLHDQGEVLSVSPSIGLSNPSLRNGTLCFLRPRSSLVLVRCPRSVKTPSRFVCLSCPKHLSVLCGRSCPAAPTLLFLHEPTRMEAKLRCP